jgi:hypothetical protein
LEYSLAAVSSSSSLRLSCERVLTCAHGHAHT